MMTFQPTPLYLLAKDAAGNEIWIKREDLLPYSFGGNKVRIALCYLAHMRSLGCDHVLAYGNARSNLCRALSNLCRGQGVPLTILSPADDDGQQRPSMNAALCRQLGARIIPCQKTGVAEAVDVALDDIRAMGHKPYYIYGDRTGQGYRHVPVAAYAEQYGPLMAQCRQQMGAAPDAIALAVGTGMTQAGLLCGQALAGDDEPQIIGLSVARDEAAVRANLAAYVQAYAQTLPSSPDLSAALRRLSVYDRCRGQYGAYDPAIDQTIRDAFARHGLPLDMTYTGKAFHALRQLMQEEGWQGRRVVFVHTGGTPLYFDQLDVRIPAHSGQECVRPGVDG